MTVNQDILKMTEKQAVNFERHIDKSGGPDACWPWMGYRGKKQPYGHVMLNGRIRMAHRVAFRLYRGYFPTHLKICHTCDNPPCCNPAHHFIGTQADNVADMDAKSRRRPALPENSGFRRHPELVKRGESNGSSILTEKNVIAIRREFASGAIYKRELARKYRVSDFAIHCVITRKTWKHLPDEFGGVIVGKGAHDKPAITKWQLDKLPADQKKNFRRRSNIRDGVSTSKFASRGYGYTPAP